MKSNPALDLVPNLDVFLNRISYKHQKIQQYRANPHFTPLERLKAILSIDDECDWILHLQQVASREPVQMLQADSNQSNAA